MRERGCYSTTTLAQPRRPCRPRHPYAVPRTLFQRVCTRRRNCIGQLSPFSEYAPGSARYPGPFPLVRRFVFRLYFLVLDGRRSIVSGHFSAMLLGNWVAVGIGTSLRRVQSTSIDETEVLFPV